MGNAIHRCIDSSVARSYILRAVYFTRRLRVLVKYCVACRRRKDLSEETLFIRHALPVRAKTLRVCTRNLPTGRRFHGRTFRNRPYQSVPEYAIVWTIPYNSPLRSHTIINFRATLAQVICQRSRTPLSFGRKKPLSRGKLNQRVDVACYARANFSKLINT